MGAVLITDDELDRLRDEPAEVFKLYVCLRRRMDRATGEVGTASAISWFALREDLSVGCAQGRREHGTPTEKAVRKKVERLVGLGLLECRTHYRRLVFFLPRARRASARAKEVGQTWVGQVGRDAGSPQSLADTGDAQEAGRDVRRVQEGEVGHTSVDGVHNLSVDTSSADQPSSLRRDAREGGDETAPSQPGEWLLWFNRHYGTCYDAGSRFDRSDLWPIFTRWCKAGIKPGEVHGAVAHAQENAKEAIASLPKYVDRMLTRRFGQQEVRGATVVGFVPPASKHDRVASYIAQRDALKARQQGQDRADERDITGDAYVVA